MHMTAINNLVLTDFSSNRWLAELPKNISHAGFYQQLVALGPIRLTCAKELFDELGRQLVAVAEQANMLRRMDTVEQVSLALQNLPFDSEHRKIADHFQALCLYHKGRLEEASELAERVAENAPLRFRARALMTLGVIKCSTGDYSGAMPFYAEASRAAAEGWCDPFTIAQTQRVMAVLKSVGGDHRGALEDLERMVPLARAVSGRYPAVYYEYANSIAVEMMEVGRYEEASKASEVALASPFASGYPEWKETRDDLEIRRYCSPRSVVSFAQQPTVKAEVLSLPLPQPKPEIEPQKSRPSPFQRQGSVISLQDWKKKMVKAADSDQEADDTAEEMSDRQMIMKILELATTDDLPDEALEKMVESLAKIVKEYEEKRNNED